MTQQNPGPPPVVGIGKATAATAAGALSIILVWVVNQVLQAKGLTVLPAEIVAAVQTLVTVAAVYFTPHGGGG